MRKIFSLFAAVLVALVANAEVINITNETPDALRLALNGASDGDEIVMAAGTYVESNGDYIAFDNKAVTVKAAEGAEVIIQPQVPITVSNGGHAIFENVKIDASRLTELADWYEHLLYVTDENPNGCTFRGCELYGFNLNKSMFYCNATNKVAAMRFENCYFHDIMKSIIFVENTAGKPMLNVKNCTFANISTNTESYWAGIIDVRAAEATLTVDHCTFYNVIPMNTDYSCVSKITLAKGNVSNCIFMLPTAQDGIRAMRGVTATNCITFNYLKDEGTGIHSSVTQNNCVQVDPAFVDPDNGNFTLGEGSPALTMNDGEPIGDPRWIPAVAPVEPLMKTIYCKMDKDWWTADGAAVGCYTWNDGGEPKAAWPGERMTPVEGEANLWSFELDINTYHMCIFTRVNGQGDVADWGAKTSDLTIPTDENDMFTITNDDPTWGDPGCTGAWSKYEPAAPVEMTTIYDWAGEIGATILGTTGVEVSTVKIHTNTDAVPAIKFGSSYVYADGKWIAIKPAEGGFKAGDVLSVALVFNNADDTKYAQIDLRAADGDTRIWLSDSASTINGRTKADEPIVQTYTLEADQDSLFLGRYGNTGMFITLLKVERAGGETPEPVLPAIALIGGMNNWDSSQGEFVAAEDKASASLTLNLAEMPQETGYAFKLLVDGVAYGSERIGGNPITFTRETNELCPVDHVAAGDDEIFWMVMDVTGEYTFTYIFAETRLIITYPALAPVEHTYTVAGGSADLFGTTWDPTNTANDMTKLEDGTYKWEKTELTLPAGAIEFKVCEDHAWSHCYPAENYSLPIPEAGIYTITITYNPEGNVVAGDAVKTGDAVVDPVVSIAGSMNGWNAAADVMTLAEDKATASLTLTLTAQTYEFKVVLNGGDWRSNAHEFTRENASAADMTGNLDNMKLTADVDGDYIFTWTFETNTLVVTFPTKEGIDNTAVDTQIIKTIENGQLIIIKNGVKYNAHGTIIR